VKTPENCKAGSVAPKEMLEDLHPSQAGAGRHKCPVCAYRIGFEDGMRAALAGGVQPARIADQPSRS